jgi:hypothetical protein
MARIEHQIEIRKQQIAKLQEEIETLQKARALLGKRKRGWAGVRRRRRRRGSASAKAAKAASKRAYSKKARVRGRKAAKKAVAKMEQQGQARQES